MNRKTLIRLGRENGWKGNDLESFKSWAIDEGIETMKVGGETVNLDQIEKVWAKTVTVSISADAGEDVVVEDASAVTEEMDEDLDEKMSDEDEAAEKSVKSAQAKRSQDNVRAWRKASVPAIHDSNSAGWSRKAYNHKAKQGGTVFADADMAEFYAATARLNSMAFHGYEQKSNDISIVTKAGASYDASLGGVLVPDSYSDQMIELLPKYGTARKYAGVYQMGAPREFIPRFGADATTYKVAENAATTESQPSFDGVWLNAEEIATLTLMPLRLLRNAAVDVADVVARSQARSQAKFEDQSFWNGSNGFSGVVSSVGSSSTHTVSGASAYTDVTVTDAQTWISKLPDWVDDYEDQIAIYCHKSVDEQIFQRFGPAAGGAATVDMTTGRIDNFRGIPIMHVNVMNNARSFTSGNVVALVGPLSAAAKFGEVSGSNEIRQSDQRYFEKRQWATQSSVEIAVNPHNVLDDAESGIWALKVTS